MILPPGKLRGLVKLARSWSKAEGVKNDICIIGSWARGDATAVSDFDLVMFCDGEPSGDVELAYLDYVPVSLFKVNARRLIESVDFYGANNVFEGRLILGSGEVLNELRRRVWGKPVDYGKTRALLYRAFSNRLRGALLELPLNCALGVRDLRTGLAKLNLYRLLFVERVDPWRLIPYRNQPSSELERTIARLCCADDVEGAIEGLDLDGAMKSTFAEKVADADRIVKVVKNAERYAGEYVANYFRLYMLTEEAIRRTAFPALPDRVELDRSFAGVDHTATAINCEDGEPRWLVLCRDENGKIVGFHQSGL